MIFNRLNSNKITDYKFDINKIIYKVSYNTLNSANNAIKHIKRNKKLYNRIVVLFAIYMLPQFIYTGTDMITMFIRELARIPKEKLTYEIFNMVYTCLKSIALFIVELEFAKTLFKTLLNKFSID